MSCAEAVAIMIIGAQASDAIRFIPKVVAVLLLIGYTTGPLKILIAYPSKLQIMVSGVI